MKAISYLRFSTPEQKLGNSTERQLEKARDYCSRNGLELDEGLSIADEGLSAYKGHNVERGSLGHFLAEVKAGKIPTGTALIVENLDRLSRQGIDETTDLLKDLTRNGIEVHVINGQVLKVGFNSKLTDYIIIGVQADLAYQESLKKSERISSAWNAKQEAARTLRTPIGNLIPGWLKIEGQKKVGDRIVDPGKIVEVPEKVAVVQEIFRLAAQGVGSRNICRQLNGRIRSRSGVAKTLRNRAVLGEFQPGKSGEVIQNYFPQIIDQSTWDAARAQMEAKRKNGKYVGGNKRKSDTAANLFSGLLVDVTSEPERNMHFQTVRDTHYLMTAFNSGATSNRMRYDRLEPAILDFLTKQDWIAIAGETDSDEYKAAKAGLEATLRQLDSVSRRIEVANAAMEKDDIDVAVFTEMSATLAKFKAVRSTLTEQKDALQVTVDAAQVKCSALSKPEDLLNLMNQHDRMKLRAEIQKRVSRIALIFLPSKQGFLAITVFTNGACRGLTSIRAGIAQIELHFDEPEGGYETMKTQFLDLARRYS